MKKKIKVEFFSPANSSDEKIKEDMAMTPQQRMSLAFRLADFAMEFTPDKTLPSKKDKISWRELTWTNGSSRKRI
ncbi:MAG: hypothetical protein SH857_04155 [Chitinophagales bacterium]|nr:hypothetical protein [Chitinophagales bacterium]